MTRYSICILALLLAPLATGCRDARFGPSFEGDVDLVDFTRSSSTVPADGESFVVLTARVPRESRRAPSSVTFITDAGTFVGSQKQEFVAPVDSTGLAVVQLKSPVDPTLATVRAFAGQSALVDTIRFIRTYPDTILVDVSKLSMLNTETMSISARVRTATGTAPSKGAQVRFQVFDVEDMPIGLLGAPTLTDANGIATVSFCPCRVPTYEGRVFIRAKTLKASGDSVSGTAIVLVTKPTGND